MSPPLDGPERPLPAITLHQFAFSHFNEKARWALDWKGIERVDHNLLPGFHFRAARRLSGATQTPILQIGSDVVAGSTAILRELDRRAPQRPLWPEDPALASETDGWLEWLDAELGPATRLALFHELLDDAPFAASIFSAGQPGWKRGAYAWIFPRMVPMFRQKMSIDEAGAARARELTTKALDRIAARTDATGYLVGDRFGAADLTAAALLFRLSFPEELPFALPDRPCEALDRWRGRWKGHPGVEWMQSTYRRHRRPA